MGFSDLWNRTLVYFGIAEEEEWDESGYVTNEQQIEETYSRRDRQNVRRLPNTSEKDDWTSDEGAPVRSRRRRAEAAPRP